MTSPIVAQLSPLFHPVSDDQRARAALLSEAELAPYPPLFRQLASHGVVQFTVPRFRALADRHVRDEYRAGLEAFARQELPIHPNLVAGKVVFDLEDGDYEVLAPDGRVLRFDFHDFDQEIVVADSFGELLSLLVREYAARATDDPPLLARGAARSGLMLARGTEALQGRRGDGRGLVSARRLGTGRFVGALDQGGAAAWRLETSVDVLRGDLVACEYDHALGRSRTRSERFECFHAIYPVRGLSDAQACYASAEHVVRDVEPRLDASDAISAATEPRRPALLTLHLNDRPDPPPVGTEVEILRNER